MHSGGASTVAPLLFRPTRSAHVRGMRLILGGATICVTVIAVLLGGALRDGSGATASPLMVPSAASGAFRAAGAPEGADTVGAVAKLQAALETDPDDVHSLDLLGLAYQQRARETGDPAYYTKSAEVLSRALRLAPGDLLATSGLGSLALSRHRFAEA